MKDYIMIWSIEDHHEMGGGTFWEAFETVRQMEDKVNDLQKDDRFLLQFAARIDSEIDFKAVERITRWEADI